MGLFNNKYNSKQQPKINSQWHIVNLNLLRQNIDKQVQSSVIKRIKLK